MNTSQILVLTMHHFGEQALNTNNPDQPSQPPVQSSPSDPYELELEPHPSAHDGQTQAAPDSIEDVDDSQMSEGALDDEQMQAAMHIEKLEQKMKQGLSWFYWIAGLSVVNMAMVHMGSDGLFLAGLTITAVIDGIGVALHDRIGMVGTILAIMVNVVILACWLAAAWVARKRHTWALAAGAIFLLADTLATLGLLLMSQSFSIIIWLIIHIIALSGFFIAWRAMRELNAIDRQVDQIEAMDYGLPR